MNAIPWIVGALLVANPALAQRPAFEIKGYTVGVDIASVEKSTCRASAMVDSGMPGFVCETTIGGDKAELKLAVFENKVAAVIAKIELGRMTPTLDALTEKYGKPIQSNRYIEDYHWINGQTMMDIEKTRLTNGYKIMILDSDLLKKSSASAAQKAKKDI